MQKNISFFICFILFFFSCDSKKKIASDSYSIKPTETQLVFPLDDKTQIYIFSLHIYNDVDGEEYLVFQNQSYPQLLFYNIKTQQLYKKINCDYEGPDAVPSFGGFFVKNMNEIYVTNVNQDGLSVIDGEGKPIHIYKNKTKEGETIHTNTASNPKSIPVINNKLYLPLSLNREYGEDVKFQKSNLCATLDLETQEFKLLPLTYFAISEREGDDLIVLYYSRCTNGKQFVYSFHESEDLFVTDLEHTTLKRIKVKSKYLPHLKFKPQKFTTLLSI